MDDLTKSLQEFDYYEDPDTIEYINEPIKLSDEVKKAIGDGNRGKVHSPEQNKKHSEFMKGCTPWNKGKKGAGYRQGTKPCTYRGKDFSSLTDAAEHFNVSISAVSRAQKWTQTVTIT